MAFPNMHVLTSNDWRCGHGSAILSSIRSPAQSRLPEHLSTLNPHGSSVRLAPVAPPPLELFFERSLRRPSIRCRQIEPVNARPPASELDPLRVECRANFKRPDSFRLVEPERLRSA